jgi:hypothetical protein
VGDFHLPLNFFSFFIPIVAAVREEIKRRAQVDADPATIEALNTIGFQNTSQAVSQEEYIRVMVICMILHPPIAAALYFGGFFDAIL